MSNPNQPEPKYPDIEVQLTGTDGNAFAIIGKVRRALSNAAYVSRDDVDTYVSEAMSGDYDHLLRTTMAWVSVS